MKQTKAIRPTKDQVRNEIVATLNRATTPHCADKIYQKLRQHNRAWVIDRDLIYKLVPELAAENRIACFGDVRTGPHETTRMYGSVNSPSSTLKKEEQNE